MNKCDKALEEQKQVIEVGDKALKKSQEEIKALKEQVSAKESQLSSIVRQPTTLVSTGVFAALLGGPLVAIAAIVIVTSILK